MAAPSDDRKFAVFSPQSVQTYAESIGIETLPDEVLLRLAEDVSYRVREMASKSCEFMRHCRRRKLKSSDVERALSWSNVQPVNGASDSLNFTSVEDFHFIEDSNVDLKEMAFSEPKPSELEPVTLTTKWIATDCGEQLADHENTDQQQQEAKDDVFKTYFSTMVNCVLSDNKPMFDEFLKDLQSNARIGPVVPYIVNFVSGANMVSHDLEKLSWMLFAVRALFDNPYVSLQLYLKPLATSVMYCVLEPLAASINPLNDHWLLRDYGARLIAQIVHSYPCMTDCLLEHVSQSLVNILSDTMRPLCSHYGAMVTVSVLGPKVIVKLLLPMLEHYLTKHLQLIIDDLSPSNAHMKEDAHKVFGATMWCVERLYDSATSDEKFLHILTQNSSVIHLFGDSLSTRVPLNKFTFPSKTSSNTNETKYICLLQFQSMNSAKYVSKSQKRNISDVFTLPLKLHQNRTIHINFGNIKPVKRRKKELEADTKMNLFSSTESSYNFPRRKYERIRKSRTNANLLSWI